MKISVLTLLFFQALFSIAQPKYVAVTIDDLPCTNCANVDLIREVNAAILNTLVKVGAPAIGFVNEKKLYTRGAPDTVKTGILNQWLEQGFDLGNHTFSHISIDNASVQQYEADLLKGEIITRPLMKAFGRELTYFRHTQLRTGPTQEYKDQLDGVLARHGYVTAPVTMDNDEYIYAYCYQQAKAQNDRESMQWIARDYIAYMERIVDHYEKLSVDFMGYQINHILLLHANELNAYHLDAVLQIFKNRGYEFVSLEEALKDPCYQMPESVSTRGLSWLNRWQLAKGVAPAMQPDVPERIRRKMASY